MEWDLSRVIVRLKSASIKFMKLGTNECLICEINEIKLMHLVRKFDVVDKPINYKAATQISCL